MPKGELLPCPFCGGEARYEEVPSALGTAWSVGCCADEADCAGYQLMTLWATRRDAAAAWNRRSDRAGLIAGLKEAAKLCDAVEVQQDIDLGITNTGGAGDSAKVIRARIAALETEEGK